MHAHPRPVIRIKGHWELSKEDASKVSASNAAQAPGGVGTSKEFMKLQIRGLYGLPHYAATAANTSLMHIRIRNRSTDQNLVTPPFSCSAYEPRNGNTLGSSDPVYGADLSDVFWVNMQNSNDKVDVLVVFGANEDAVEGSEQILVGYANFPHFDERVMKGNEVGLRVHVVDDEEDRPPPVYKCVLKVKALWSEHALASMQGTANGTPLRARTHTAATQDARVCILSPV